MSDNSPDMKILIENEFIVNSASVKILGVNFDNKLSCNLHVDKLCKKAGQKLHALARLSNFVDHRKLIMNAFISSTIQLLSLTMNVP